MLMEEFPGLVEMSVVDLGGTTESWLRAPVMPRSVTIVNMFEPGSTDDLSITPLLGDACNAVEALVAAGIEPTFDLVYCNSVIEHVGGHVQRTRLAKEVAQLAPRHWVQTPYRYFPIEPHWVCPMMQFLPVALAAQIAYRWPLAHSRPGSYEQARDGVLWTELQSATEMKAYFPRSTIRRERFAGVTKSLIAVASEPFQN
jgi:hypothetical protein